MEKLIFIGGNRGVGKTSLATYIRENFQIPYVQYSEFNIKKSIERWGKLDWVQLSEPSNAAWINGEFINYVNKNLESKGRLLIDGHYSYYDSPPFSIKEFNRLVSSKRSLLILITAPLENLLERIKKDKRDRSLDVKKISEDIQWNQEMFELYSRGTLGEKYILFNEDFESSRKRLGKRISRFLLD